jgi:hypothetical protein
MPSGSCGAPSAVGRKVPREDQPGYLWKLRSTILVKLIDHDRDPRKHSAATLDQFTGRTCLAPAFDPIINQQHLVSRVNRLALDLQDMVEASIVETGLNLALLAWKQTALLAYRPEANAQRTSGGAAENEASGLDPADLRDSALSPRRDQGCDDFAECLAVTKDAPDIRVAVLPLEPTKKRVGPLSVCGTH